MNTRNIVAKMLSSTATKALSLARHLDNPELMRLRKRGLPRECYQSLNRQWLRSLDPRTILDIGANTGQFAVAANAIFTGAAVYSFEPLPDWFETLKKNMSGVKEFRAFNIGLGAAHAELQFNRSSFAPSSSFRKMATLHKETYPWTAGSETVDVQVETLDCVTAAFDLKDPILLKIDVQGYEDQVLAGGKSICSRAAVIIIEISFETLYEGQPLFDDIYRTLISWGFAYKGSLEQAVDPKSDRYLYADAIFLRMGASQADPAALACGRAKLCG